MTIATKLDELFGRGGWSVTVFEKYKALDHNELDSIEETRGAFGQPEWVKYLPEARHSIRDERAVCEGDRGNRCHWYPTCDDHESWPCGCDYVAHDECWMIPWLDAGTLVDTAFDSALEARDDDTLEFPDGPIICEWDGEFVLWDYEAPEPPDPQLELMRSIVNDPDGTDVVMIERADIRHLLKLGGLEGDKPEWESKPLVRTPDHTNRRNDDAV